MRHSNTVAIWRHRSRFVLRWIKRTRFAFFGSLPHRIWTARLTYAGKVTCSRILSRLAWLRCGCWGVEINWYLSHSFSLNLFDAAGLELCECARSAVAVLLISDQLIMIWRAARRKPISAISENAFEFLIFTFSRWRFICSAHFASSSNQHVSKALLLCSDTCVNNCWAHRPTLNHLSYKLVNVIALQLPCFLLLWTTVVLSRDSRLHRCLCWFCSLSALTPDCCGSFLKFVWKLFGTICFCIYEDFLFKICRLENVRISTQQAIAFTSATVLERHKRSAHWKGYGSCIVGLVSSQGDLAKTLSLSFVPDLTCHFAGCWNLQIVWFSYCKERTAKEIGSVKHWNFTLRRTLPGCERDYRFASYSAESPIIPKRSFWTATVKTSCSFLTIHLSPAQCYSQGIFMCRLVVQVAKRVQWFSNTLSRVSVLDLINSVEFSIPACDNRAKQWKYPKYDAYTLL